MDLSIVIVSHNVRRHLEGAIAAVLADTQRLAAEVIVVDNASTDGSADAVRRAFPGIAVIANAENRYYTGGNNQGLALARGRFALLLNPDAEIRPGTLPALLEVLSGRPEIGLASCRMLWVDGRLQHNCSAERSFTALLLENTPLGTVLAPLRGRLRRREWYAEWDRTSEREVGVLPGSFLLVRGAALAAVGGLEERLWLYFAEDVWCARMRHHGLGVRYLPLGAVVHPEGASVRQAPRAARAVYFRDLSRYAEMRFGRAQALVLTVLAAPFHAGLDAAGRLRGERR